MDMNEEYGLTPYETREILFYKTDKDVYKRQPPDKKGDLCSHQNCIPIQTPISFSFSASIAPKRNFIQKREDKFPPNPNISLQNGDSIAKFA